MCNLGIYIYASMPVSHTCICRGIQATTFELQFEHISNARTDTTLAGTESRNERIHSAHRNIDVITEFNWPVRREFIG
jgi:hypothetical protein